MLANQEVKIPDLSAMSEDHIKQWLSSLSNDQVYANFRGINYALMARFGEQARVSVSTYQQPKLIFVL